MHVGILTGGGDCPGINAVIRAAVYTSIRRYGSKVTGVVNGFEGLLDPLEVMELGIQQVKGLHVRGGTILGSTNRGNPFEYQHTRPDGTVESRDRSREVEANFKQLGLDVLLVIGGDGTQALGFDFHRRGMPIVGVPKTIDNDLPATELTFGFDTAVKTATWAIGCLTTTGESHHRVMYLEVMGRHAGHIALHAGIAGGADVILIPEIPFSAESIRAHITKRAGRGDLFTMVVVAEGARPAGGELVYQELDAATGVARLGGVAERVGAMVAQDCDQEYRVTVLGHMQRGGIPTARDRILCTRFGAAAARAAHDGQFGQLVSLQESEIELRPLEEAIGHIRTVDPEGDLVQTARDIGISLGD